MTLSCHWTLVVMITNDNKMFAITDTWQHWKNALYGVHIKDSNWRWYTGHDVKQMEKWKAPPEAFVLLIFLH